MKFYCIFLKKRRKTKKLFSFFQENGGEVPDKAADGAFIKRRLFQAQIHQFGMRDGSPVMHSPSRQDSAIRLRSLYHPVGVIS